MDYTKEVKQLNREYAIKGEVKTKLTDILQNCTKDKLSSIASNCDLSGRSKMKKPELVTGLHEHILDEERLQSALLLATPKEWELFDKLLNKPSVEDTDLAPGDYLFLMGKGLVFSFLEQDKLYYLIPEEVKDAYHNIQTESFRKTRDRYHLVLQYIQAASNLYGVCKPEKFIEIFNAQNDEKLNEAEFTDIYRFLTGRAQPFSVNQDYLLSDYFEDGNQEELEELLKRVNNKPYYIPGKNQFLKYSDSVYYELTPQLIRLKTFILQNLCKEEELAQTIVEDIQVACSMEEPFQEIMAEFEHRNIHIKNTELIKALAALINDVYNHTRLWSNRGRTPFEVQKSFGGPVRGQEQTSKMRTLSKQRIANKIGRNEPCPCGSGKKHKKCCGK